MRAAVLCCADLWFCMRHSKCACLPCKRLPPRTLPHIMPLRAFFSSLPQQATFDFGDDSSGNATDAAGPDGSSADGSGVKSGTVATGLDRLKNAGSAISAYEPEPIAASGAVGLACGFGWVDPNFQVGGVQPLYVVCRTPWLLCSAGKEWQPIAVGRAAWVALQTATAVA